MALKIKTAKFLKPFFIQIKYHISLFMFFKFRHLKQGKLILKNLSLSSPFFLSTTFIGIEIFQETFHCIGELGAKTSMYVLISSHSVSMCQCLHNQLLQKKTPHTI